MKLFAILTMFFLMGCNYSAESNSLSSPIHYYELESTIINLYDCEGGYCLAQVQLDKKGLVKEMWRFREEIKVGEKAFKKCWFRKVMSKEDMPKTVVQKERAKIEETLGNNNCKKVSYIKH